MMRYKIGIIILAAGKSERLGYPKQLLKINNKTLVQRMIDFAKALEVSAVYLITGAYHHQVERELSDDDIHVIHNPDYKNGMGVSISVGVRQAIMDKLDAVIITMVDQRYLELSNLVALMDRFANPTRIIISDYEEGSGPPSIFGSAYFDELSKLTGDHGAKPMVKKYYNLVSKVSFQRGNIDIDTPEDLQYLE